MNTVHLYTNPYRRLPGEEIPVMLSKGTIKHFVVPFHFNDKIIPYKTRFFLHEKETVCKGSATVTGIEEIFIRISLGNLIVYYENEQPWSRYMTKMFIRNCGFHSDTEMMNYLISSLGVNTSTVGKRLKLLYFGNYGYDERNVICLSCGTLKHSPAGSYINPETSNLICEDNTLGICTKCIGKTFAEFGYSFLFPKNNIKNRNVLINNDIFERISMRIPVEAFFYYNIPRSHLGNFSISKIQDPNRPKNSITIRIKRVITEKRLAESAKKDMVVISRYGTIKLKKKQFLKNMERINGQTENIYSDLFSRQFVKGNIKFEHKQ